MQIREIQSQDREQLIEMMSVFYASPALLHHPTKSVIERTVDDCIGDMPYLKGFAAILDGKIVGYTMLSMGYSTEYGGVSIMIEDIYVLSEYRGRKIGESLLEHVQTVFGDAVRFRLEVESNNEKAIKLYARCGFKKLNYTQMTKEK